MRRTVLSYACDCLCPTATAQQKGMFIRNGRPVFFTKKRTVEAENDWWSILKPARDAFGPALAVPCAVSIRMEWPFLKSTPKRTVALGAAVPLAARPDADNLVKALLDVMTKMQFWADDGLVFALTVEKWRGPSPGLRLELQEWTDAPDELFGRAAVSLDLRKGGA